MTEGQKYLFKLFSEVDEICKKHNIRYYLAGGTLIGAIRHRGFVPWDDDFDIYMTRDEFLKFVEVAKNGGLPQDRKLECQELNHDYRNAFARYTDTSNAAIHKNQLISDDIAGEVLDILQLDPVPDGEEALKKHIEYIMLYSDIINPSVSYSGRDESNSIKYFYYHFLEKVIGRDKVLSIIEKKIFGHKEEDCNRYVMRWGGTPLIFDKRIFEPASYAYLNGIKSPIPRMSNDYLRDHYSDDWMFVPHVSEQSSHEAVHSLTTSYTYIRDDFTPYINKKRILKNYNKHKANTIIYGKNGHIVADTLVKLRGVRLREELEYAIGEKDIDVIKLLEEKKYKQINDLFKSYYTMQYSPQFIGRDNFKNYYRFKNPLLIKLSEEHLYVALMSQVLQGNVAKPYRVLEVYEATCGELPPKLKLIKEYVERQRLAITHFSLKEYEQAYQVMVPLLEEYPDNISLIKLKLRLIFILNWPIEEIEKYVKGVMPQYPKDGEFLKFAGDVDRLKGDEKEACEKYLKAKDMTTNGCILLEINDNIEDYIEKLLVGLKENLNARKLSAANETYSEIMRFDYLDIVYKADIALFEHELLFPLSNERAFEILKRLDFISSVTERYENEINMFREQILRLTGETQLTINMRKKYIDVKNDEARLLKLVDEVKAEMDNCQATHYSNLYYSLLKILGDLYIALGQKNLGFHHYMMAIDKWEDIYPIMKLELTEIFQQDMAAYNHALRKRQYDIDAVMSNYRERFQSEDKVRMVIKKLGLDQDLFIDIFQT